jgi:hypothetical protein
MCWSLGAGNCTRPTQPADGTLCWAVPSGRRREHARVLHGVALGGGDGGHRIVEAADRDAPTAVMERREDAREHLDRVGSLWNDPGKPVPYTGKPLPYTGKLWNDPGKPVPYTGKPLPYAGKLWNDPGKPVPYTGKPLPYTGKLWNDPGKPVPYTGKPVPYTGKPLPYTGKLWNDPGKPVPYTGKLWNDAGKPPTTSPWPCTRRCDRPFMHEGERRTGGCNVSPRR